MVDFLEDELELILLHFKGDGDICISQGGMT